MELKKGQKYFVVSKPQGALKESSIASGIKESFIASGTEIGGYELVYLGDKKFTYEKISTKWANQIEKGQVVYSSKTFKPHNCEKTEPPAFADFRIIPKVAGEQTTIYYSDTNKPPFDELIEYVEPNAINKKSLTFTGTVFNIYVKSLLPENKDLEDFVDIKMDVLFKFADGQPPKNVTQKVQKLYETELFIIYLETLIPEGTHLREFVKLKIPIRIKYTDRGAHHINGPFIYKDGIDKFYKMAELKIDEDNNLEFLTQEK